MDLVVLGHSNRSETWCTSYILVFIHYDLSTRDIQASEEVASCLETPLSCICIFVELEEAKYI